MCVFSIVELSAQDDMDDLEKKNFFKIERLENELILLKDQYKLLIEQERLNVEKETESEVLLDLETQYIELNTKVNSLNKEILVLKNQYKLLSENQGINTQEQSESLEGFDPKAAFFNLNSKANSLNDEILALKDQYELLTEGQRLNTQKINELFEIIELNTTKKQKTDDLIKTDKEKSAFKLYSDGKSQFALGNYELSLIHI